MIGKIKGAGHPDTGKTQPLSNSAGYVREDLGLADSEHFRTAARAYALGRRLAILHGNGLASFISFLDLHLKQYACTMSASFIC